MMYGMEKSGRIRPSMRSNRRNARRPNDEWNRAASWMRERIAIDGIMFNLDWSAASDAAAESMEFEESIGFYEPYIEEYDYDQYDYWEDEE